MAVLVRDGFVDADSLAFTLNRDPETGRVIQITLEGVIRCASGVAIEITKHMDVRDDGDGELSVLSTYYRYHAWRPRQGGHSLIRYDQAHGQAHCHRFAANGEPDRHVMLTLDTMPRLDEVIREAVDIARAWDAEPS